MHNIIITCMIQQPDFLLYKKAVTLIISKVQLPKVIINQYFNTQTEDLKAYCVWHKV